MKKMTSLILVAVLLLSLLSTQALATEAGDTAGIVGYYYTRAEYFKTGTWTGTDSQKLVQVVEAQLGMKGSDFRYGYDWSAFFVCDAAHVAGISQDVIPLGAGIVPNLYTKLLDLGAKEIAVSAIQPGDLVFFDYGRKSQSDVSYAEDLDHVVVAISYNSTTNILACIGGNQGTKSGAANREVTQDIYNTAKYTKIAHVIRPKYSNSEEETTYTLTLQTVGSGYVTGAGKYRLNEYAQITATPAEGNTFVGWFAETGDNLSTAQTASVWMQRDIKLTAHFAEIEDKPDSWAESEVQAAISLGLVPASLQSHYTSYLTRAQVVEMFVSLLEKASGKTIEQIVQENDLVLDYNAFEDTKDAHILACHALGIIEGTDPDRGIFDPYLKLTRAQAAAIINRVARVLGEDVTADSFSFSDTESHWVKNELGWPVGHNILKGVGENKFDPEAYLKNQEAIAIVYRAYNVLRDELLKYSITCPEGYLFEYIGDSMNLYELSSYQAGFGGRVYTITLYSNKDYNMLPVPYKCIGTLTKGDVSYDVVVVYPSDVQFDPEKYADIYEIGEEILKTLKGENGYQMRFG